MLNKKLSAITLLLLVCLMSCTPSPSNPSEPGVLIGPALKCPEVDIYSKPPYSNKAVYALLDNSGSYENYYSVASQRLQEVLHQTLRPGDFIGLGLIGIEAANVTMSNLTFPHPKEPTYPSYAPTLTPLPENALGSDLQQHEIDNGYIVQDNEELTSEYYCLIDEWNKSYDLSAINRDKLQVFQTIRNAIPAQSQSEGSTDIQSAMFNAYDFFDQANRQGYTSRYLIVFSDMVETEPPREWVESIDLSGVYVIVAMVPFDSNSNEVSGLIESKKEWANWFGVYRAVGFELLTIPNSSASIITSYMEK